MESHLGNIRCVLLPTDSQGIEWNEDPAQHVRHGQGDDDQIKPLNIWEI